jgi:cytochrome bd-type quinol oxidase subunit 2
MQIAYDESFLVKAAENLEQQARSIVISVTLRYGLGFLAVAYIATAYVEFASRHAIQNRTTIELVALAIGIAAGVAIGRDRAFRLRVEVQKLMALVAIARSVSVQDIQRVKSA